MSGPSLSQVIAVLDRADAQAVPPSDERQKLLNAVLAADTAHAPETLAHAVDAELARVPVSPSAASLPYTFPWRRPRSQAELDVRRHTGRRARWAAQSRRLLPLWTFLGCLGIFGLALGSEQIGHEAHPLLSSVVRCFAAALTWIIPCSVLSRWILSRCAQSTASYASAVVSAPELERYLNTAPTRAYIDAVMASGVPELLVGDLDHLKVITRQHHTQTQAALEKSQQERQARQQAERLAQLYPAQNKRETLVKAALSLNTGHHPEDVEAGVEAYLSQPTTGLSFSDPPRAFGFGWDRPKNEHEQSEKEAKFWPSRIGRHSLGVKRFSRPARIVGAGAGGLVFITILGMAIHSGHIGAGLAAGFMAGCIALVFGMGLTDLVVDGCARTENPYQESVLDEGALETFLSFPASRAYLRALRASGCSRLLVGDGERLKVLCREGVATRQRKAAQRARQQRLDHQNTQMDQLLATMGNDPSEEISP